MFKISNKSNPQNSDEPPIYNGNEEKTAYAKNETFSALVVHDLKTPINAQIHALEFLLKNLTVNDRVLYEIIKDILNAAKYMKTLTDNILQKYKCENNRLVLYKTKFSLEKLTIQCVDELKYLFCDKNINVKINSLIDKQEFEFDVTEIKRVILNLLTNAITYGVPDTDILINLYAVNTSAVFSITNHAAVIASVDFNKIFEKFESFCMCGKSAGTGLGLYISKLIIEAHGGKIFVESKVNEITITFILPRELPKEPCQCLQDP